MEHFEPIPLQLIPTNCQTICDDDDKSPNQVIILLDITNQQNLASQIVFVLDFIKSSPNHVHFDLLVHQHKSPPREISLNRTKNDMVSDLNKFKNESNHNQTIDMASSFKCLFKSLGDSVSESLDQCLLSIRPKSSQKGDPVIVLFSYALPPRPNQRLLKSIRNIQSQSVHLLAVVQNGIISNQLDNCPIFYPLKMNDLLSTLFKQQNSDFSIEVILDQESKAQKLNENVVLKMSIKPENKPLPPKSYLQIGRNEFYYGVNICLGEQGVQPDESRTIPFTLKPIQNTFATRMPPSRIQFKIVQDPTNEKVKVLTQGYFSIPTALFSGEFFDFQLVVVIDGKAGSGKSTVINGIYNTFHDREIKYPYFTSNCGAVHGTHAFNFTPMCDILQKNSKLNSLLIKDIIDNLNVTVVDKKGYTESDTTPVISGLLNGQFRHNETRLYQETDPNYKVNGCILVASIKSFVSETSTDFTMIRTKVRELLSNKIHPILAITFLDELSENEMTLPKANIATLGVEVGNIFYMDNYLGHTKERMIEKDYQNFELLLCARKLAENYINNL
ncbi:hypothetical protein DFA_00464 [Cavenderia fasciculata]|uniref:Uncharacterized protein n=1 Tax=Cavenderia fasciculata TaxID=261658 RepID=F4PS05_CACFS|nr:uncharacterized protein DFA_00464 [Cavenderia fasciculata]EGG20603.1 hypothetical protein DFA_00464 [Cavenderia fasciculata]|eukprot:XP_004358453.1 hypothetical protein DFA_00464 [Cavenderia fasciculata]